jgi:hypothetical protein
MARYTPEQRKTYLEAWEQSGLSCKAFAKQCGVAIATLKTWQRGRQPLNFQPVIIDNAPVKESTTRVIAEATVGMVAVRLFAGIGTDDIVTLISALKRSAS